MTEAENEQGQAQGRPGQEGQAEVRYTPIFDELAFGRNHLFMEIPPAVQAIDDLEPCQICKRPKSEHGSTRHTFTPRNAQVDVAQFAAKRSTGTGEGDDARRRPQTPQVSYRNAPFDPVLRQALIDAGVITVEQLEAAQRKITAITQEITEQ